jgi:NAD(P)-dependent dehydrogenase (short-subunit alcohol dehydrogenase family)
MSEPETPSVQPPIRDLIDLTARVALVTGSGRGIGSGIAKRLAEAGAAVVVADRERVDRERTAREIEAAGGRSCAVSMDVADEVQVRGAVDLARATFGRLDAIVNCAGIQPLRALMEQSVEDWDAMMATNLRGVFLGTREGARIMIEQGTGGSIVNIASIEGLQPAWHHSHYDVTKAGVIMHTRAAALELGRHGIRVNAISPGLIWSPSLETAWPEGVRRFLDHVPLGRLGQPDDIADAVLYLISPMSRFVTGANLVVDGGVLAHPTW